MVYSDFYIFIDLLCVDYFRLGQYSGSIVVSHPPPYHQLNLSQSVSWIPWCVWHNTNDYFVVTFSPNYEQLVELKIPLNSDLSEFLFTM